MACRTNEQARLVDTARKVYARVDQYVADHELQPQPSLTALSRARDAARSAHYALGFAMAGNCASARQALRHATRLTRAAVRIDALEARGLYRRGPRPND